MSRQRIRSELGDDGLTMRNIAAAIGVSPTLLYQHFDSKASILVHGVALAPGRSEPFVESYLRTVLTVLAA